MPSLCIGFHCVWELTMLKKRSENVSHCCVMLCNVCFVSGFAASRELMASSQLEGSQVTLTQDICIQQSL